MRLLQHFLLCTPSNVYLHWNTMPYCLEGFIIYCYPLLWSASVMKPDLQYQNIAEIIKLFNSVSYIFPVINQNNITIFRNIIKHSLQKNNSKWIKIVLFLMGRLLLEFWQLKMWSFIFIDFFICMRLLLQFWYSTVHKRLEFFWPKGKFDQFHC